MASRYTLAPPPHGRYATIGLSKAVNVAVYYMFKKASCMYWQGPGLQTGRLEEACRPWFSRAGDGGAVRLSAEDPQCPGR